MAKYYGWITGRPEVSRVFYYLRDAKKWADMQAAEACINSANDTIYSNGKGENMEAKK